jgi:hypothetical protein
LELAKWLVGTYKLTWDELCGSDLFDRACRKGSIDMMKWLRSRPDFGAYPWACFETTCFEGHLDVACWLKDTFDLKDDNRPDNARYDFCALFCVSCAIAHWDMAKWLYQCNLPSTTS